jgi:hypothetical protein
MLMIISSSRPWSANWPARSPPPTSQTLRPPAAASIAWCTARTSPDANLMSAPGTAGSWRWLKTQQRRPG